MAEDEDRGGKPKPGPAPLRALDILQIGFLVAGGSGAIFALRGPAHNEGQALFRLGLMGVGLVGLVVVTILKLTSRRRS